MQGLLPLMGAGMAVLGLVALSAWLGFRGQPVLEGEHEARALAQSISGGFAAATVLLADDGRYALLSDSRGRVAVVLPHGAHFIARAIDCAMTAQHDDTVLDLVVGRETVRIPLGQQLPAWVALIDQSRVQA